MENLSKLQNLKEFEIKKNDLGKVKGGAFLGLCLAATCTPDGNSPNDVIRDGKRALSS